MDLAKQPLEEPQKEGEGASPASWGGGTSWREEEEALRQGGTAAWRPSDERDAEEEEGRRDDHEEGGERASWQRDCGLRDEGQEPSQELRQERQGLQAAGREEEGQRLLGRSSSWSDETETETRVSEMRLNERKSFATVG